MKQFIVDWNSYEEVSKLGNKIKCRLGELNPNRVSKGEKTRLLFDVCLKIYNTDITHLYNNLTLDSNKIYYVYAHLNPTKKIAIGKSFETTFAAVLGMDCFPFYIGKGSGTREHLLKRNETHRKVREEIQALGSEMKVLKISESISELDALCMESKLIDIFGLVPFGGKLTNLDEGLYPELRRQCYINEYNLITGAKNHFKMSRENHQSLLLERNKNRLINN